MEENKISETKKEPLKEARPKSELDKIIDFLFSNDELKWLLFVVILGGVLRFLMAQNVSANGDEMVHGPHSIGFLHSGLISTLAQSPLWFYLNDIAFKFLGVSLFSIRFLSFFYGTLSICVVYLIASKILTKKTAVFSAFLLSISFYIVRHTLSEMDLAAIFFILLAAYLFVISKYNKKIIITSAVCLGIASLIKTLSLFFVPAFLLGFFLFDPVKEGRIKRNIGKAIAFGLIILIGFSPILIHNYIWYKDKGMVDVYFAQYFNIEKTREAYAGQAGYDSGVLYPQFFDGVYLMSKYIFTEDPIIVILALLGIILLLGLREKRKYLIFLLVFELSGFVLLVLSNWLPTHYTTMIPTLCIFGGVALEWIRKKTKNLNLPKIMTLLILVILAFQLYHLWPYVSTKSALSQMRSYASASMDKNSIVIADSRIYRGRTVFLFNDFHYLESNYFSQIMAMNANMTGTDIPTKVYFIECNIDDCGWGTIKDQPDLNRSMEQLFDMVKKNAKQEKVLNGGGGYDEPTGVPVFTVYQATINIKPAAINLIDSTHIWFYYPVNYLPKNQIFDQYSVKGPINSLLYMIAWAIMIASIIIAITLPILLILHFFDFHFFDFPKIGEIDAVDVELTN